MSGDVVRGGSAMRLRGVRPQAQPGCLWGCGGRWVAEVAASARLGLPCLLPNRLKVKYYLSLYYTDTGDKIPYTVFL